MSHIANDYFLENWNESRLSWLENFNLESDDVLEDEKGEYVERGEKIYLPLTISKDALYHDE